MVVSVLRSFYQKGRQPGFLTLLLLLVVLTSHPLCGASALLTLSGVSAVPGSGVVLPLELQSNGNAVSGVQFDIVYDNSPMSISASLGAAARGAGKILYQVDLAPNIRRFLIVGLNSGTIPSGILVTVFINLSPNAAQGSFPLSFYNLTATDPGGIPSALEASDALVTISRTSGQAVPLQSEGVLNGASLLPGAMVPGEIFTLIGSNIGVSNNTSVSFDGFAAALYYVGANQINGLTPDELQGRTDTLLHVVAGGRTIAGLALTVAEASPAIFTLDASGAGQGAILNQDSSVNSPANPASRGDIVALFATGWAPSSQVSVQIGGLDAEILYSGNAPGLISGLRQVNCRVPATLVPGYAISIILTIGGVSSPTGVTLAVQ